MDKVIFAFLSFILFIGTAAAFTETNTSYFYANGQRIARAVNGSSVEYYHSDQLGSTSFLTNSSGSTVMQESYDPYGNTLQVSGSSSTNYGFTGKELDSKSNLYYYGARYYDPVIGRFITADKVSGKLGKPQTLNRYSYVSNNPLKLIDPSGNAEGEAKYNYYAQSDASNVSINPVSEWEMAEPDSFYSKSGYGAGNDFVAVTGKFSEAAWYDSTRNVSFIPSGIQGTVVDEVTPAIVGSAAGLLYGLARGTGLAMETAVQKQASLLEKATAFEFKSRAKTFEYQFITQNPADLGWATRYGNMALSAKEKANLTKLGVKELSLLGEKELVKSARHLGLELVKNEAKEEIKRLFALIPFPKPQLETVK